MGPLKVVTTPMLQRLMRGVDEPYLRPPLVQMPTPASTQPGINPWFQGVGAYDMEYGASMQPRSNPAFNDTWVAGATAGASEVVPQGIDYSRTNCCMPMNGFQDVSPLFIGVVGIPLAVLFFSWLSNRMAPSRRR